MPSTAGAGKGDVACGVALLLLGVVVCVIAAADLIGYAVAGQAAYASSKHGLTFVGTAAVILSASIGLCGSLLAVVGWTMIRRQASRR